MKATLEDITGVKKKLRVEIDAEDVNKKLNKAYGDIRKRAKIPGFRPGKAPRKVLESRFHNQVAEDVTRELISESFPKAVDEAHAFPLGQPILEKGTLAQGHDFVYSAIMEVRPRFELKDYLGIPLEKETLDVSDEDVQKRLEEIRAANGKLTSLQDERPIQEGDYVIVDYKALEDGRPIDGVQTSNLMVKVGKHDFHPQFDEALIGLAKDDEKDILIDFHKDFYHPQLAGKRVNFETRIIDVKELALPELNDAFAASLGSDFKDLEGLKNEVRKVITSQEQNRIDTDLKQRLLEKISEGINIELPEVLIEAQTNYSVERVRGNLQRNGSSLEKQGLSEERLRTEFRPVSEKRVRDMLILEQIAKQDQIELADEDIQEGYRNLARETGQDAETIRHYYESGGQVDSFKEELLKEKTLKYLIDHATISKISKDALAQDQNP